MGQPFRVAQELWVVGVQDPYEVGRYEMFLGQGQVGRQQFAEQRVFADGPQVAVEIVFFVGSEGDRQQSPQLLLVVTETGGNKAVDLVGTDAYEFVFGRFGRGMAVEGIDHIHLTEGRCDAGRGTLLLLCSMRNSLISR